MSNDILVAKINARVTQALIKALGMQAENLQREHRGESMAYMEEAFVGLIDDKNPGGMDQTEG